MSEKSMPADWRRDEGRPLEDIIRAALRCDGLLVPQTVQEVARFEDELARNPVATPAHVLTSEWLFRSVSDVSEQTTPQSPPVKPADNLAIAARDGTEIPDNVTARMMEDRARHGPEAMQHVARTGIAHGQTIQFGSVARLKDIAELAEWIAKERCLPCIVVPAKIARENSIGTSFNDYEEAFDGLLEHQGGRFHIYCNLRRVESEDSDRARFTLSHELAHFFIDAHRHMLERGQSLPLSQCDYESAVPIEREADCFAAHLLMPSDRFVKQARGMKPGFATILSLRRHFGTSVTSTACRYATLGIAQCVVVKWSKNRVGWSFMSEAAREAGLGMAIKSAAHLPTDSPTAKVLSGSVSPSKGFFEAGTTAAFWFPGVTSGSFRNAILVEQAISLGRFGALTVLYPESGGFPHAA